MGGGFAKASHIEDYLRYGNYPDIHARMFETLQVVPLAMRRGLLDLAACTGLLGIRARTQLHYAPVVALDASEHYAGVFKALLAGVAPITYLRKALDFDCDQDATYLRGLVENFNIGTVAARRCLPEILGDPAMPGNFERCQTRASRFGQALRDGGVKFLALEGRRRVKNPRHALYSITQEIRVMRSTWPRVIHRDGDCAILQ